MFGGSLGKISTKGDWRDAFLLIDEETNEALDLTDCDVTFNVTPKTCESAILSGSTTGGEIILPDTGYIEWTFAASRLSNIAAGTYDVGVVITRDDETLQLFLGTITIERGR